ncbi:hypothetical protein H7S55_05385 [Priestia aryabhattai]|uniref:PIN-like domain-containing protein n=1 Tax=Priestia aryabhattai TaxID=412384 RepID=UPI001C8F11C2|nr:PIN-like domain-containing protein [Priestia aryabhattai]MBX9999588.1 hypothetical protein [Priestia aryabhattai]
MLQQFKGFIGYTDEEFKELWGKSIFVVDTNVLLNFYKYTSKESTKSLLDILKKLKEGGRLWIPHQVALEYFYNYENNMFKQQEGYDLLSAELKKLKEDAEKILSTVKSKHPYIITDKFYFFIDSMEQSNNELQEQINKEIEELPDSKRIQKDVLILLDGIIGESYTQDRINVIEKEGKERYKYNVPPGFKDRDDNNKQIFRTYGDIRYQQLYGDLIVWNQMIDRAKVDENPVSIIFITEEKKEDWWEKDTQKRIKRPQPQLIQEFYNKTQQNFYMYRTENFVKYAKEYLGAEVTDEQVENVTKDVEQIRKSEEKEEDKNRQDDYGSNDAHTIKLNVAVSKLLEYLSETEQEELRKRIDQAFQDINQQVTNAKYNNAIRWAIHIAVPRLEKKAKELTSEIALISYGKAQLYIDKLISLPQNPIERGMVLLNTIGEMQYYLVEQELPF